MDVLQNTDLDFFDDLDDSLGLDLPELNDEDHGLWDGADDSEDFDERRYVKPLKVRDMHVNACTYDNAKKLAKDLDIYEKDFRYYFIVSGTFIFGDLIEALIVENKLKVKKLDIATLGMSEDNIDSLALLLNLGFVSELNLLVSDYYYSHYRSNMVKYMYERLDVDNKFQLSVCRTHMKLALLELECGRKIIMHGSANLRSSDNLEHINLEENDILFDFNLSIMDKIKDKYNTIKKSIGGKKLFNLIND